MIMPSIAKADTLTRQLELGMTGSDVGSLQTFLSEDPAIYPQGLVTNYFGFLTKAAVSNFQSANGISSVGRVGPVTLSAINGQMNGNGISNSTGPAPIISGVTISNSRNSAVISWNTNSSAKGKVYYSSSPLTTYERLNSVDVSGAIAMADSNYRNTQSVTLPNLSASTIYYYLIYVTDQQGDVSVTWPASFQTTN